jgi:outer membrane protein TolC
MVWENHPVTYQSGIQIQKADADLLRSRGGFDPVVAADWRQKDLKVTRYYDDLHGSVKIPTWFGAELSAGFDQNSGVFLNPENSTPDPGLWFAGIEIPVGAGLLMDQRRAELRKAQIYQQSSQAEARQMLNDLMLDAGYAYWSWFAAKEIYRIQSDAVTLAEQRMQGVVESALAGDRPYMDTVEAGIQVQNRKLNEQQALLNLQNAAQFLSVFLWADGRIPLELQECAIPVSADSLGIQLPDLTARDSLISSHPMLTQAAFKIDRLDIDRRLKREKLRPYVGLKYQALNTRAENGEVFSELNVADYAIGLEFKMPIFLRGARGDVRMAELKIEEAQLDFGNKRNLLDFKVTKSMNDLETTDSQIQLYQQTVRDYGMLLQGERTRFEAGESSLFLVNAREVGLIQAQVKLVDLLVKNQSAALSFRHALGVLGDR